jgi:hypothetical protein
VPQAAFSTASELEIVTYNNVLRTKAVNQDSPDKCVNGNAAHLLVKLRAIEKVDTVGCQRIKFLAEPHQPCRRACCGKELSGHRLETHDNRWQAKRFRCSFYPFKQRCMP